MDESTTRAVRARSSGRSAAPRRRRALTGSRAYERFTGPQIRKFAEQRSCRLRGDTHAIHLVSSYLASLLAGADAPIDTGDGSGMNLMDLAPARWSAGGARRDRAGPRGEAAADRRRRGRSSGRSRRTGSGATAFRRPRSSPGPATTRAASSGTGIVDEGTLGGLARHERHGVCDARASRAPACRTSSDRRRAAIMSLVCFRNGSLARERIRDEYGARLARTSRAALADTPRRQRRRADAAVVRAGDHAARGRARRPALRSRSRDAARNVRAVVEAQMMAMANHSAA